MLYYKRGHIRLQGRDLAFRREGDSLSSQDLQEGLYAALKKLGPRKKVLAVPPDITRFHSRAGEITNLVWKYYGDKLTDILPATGTHYPMTDKEIAGMFSDTPRGLFRNHNFRGDLAILGRVPATYIKEVSEGSVDYDWPAATNRLIAESGFDLILSIGQVVPHEVIGMASYNKNIFVGAGGAEGINKSHFLGAVYGMERIMGRADSPVRRVINYACDHFAKDLPIVYVHTVVGACEDGRLATRGLFIGDDIECFNLAAELALEVNFKMLDEPLKKVVVYLAPKEYKSTWLGNKSIYRTRMAIANGGELIVLAPGLAEFGEDPQIDRLIRKYGYVGTPKVLELVKDSDDLKENLSAAAHLIHGSSEERFSITYCPGEISKQEIESVNFKYADLKQMMKKYNPQKLKDGFNKVGGEEIFFISNPGLGLWSWKEKFKKL